MSQDSYAKIIQALSRNGHRVTFFKTRDIAAEYIAGEIAKLSSASSASECENITVGLGDSRTLAELKLDERLSSFKNLTVFNPARAKNITDFLATARRALVTDVFLTSVNAAAETGEMVNIDGTGNRVAGSLFGHKKVFFVFGTNKIAPNLDAAIYRARNIAAPHNARRHKYKTPCAFDVTFREPSECSKCYDCASADRICNSLVIYLRAQRFVESEVVIINESLGL